MKIVLFLLVFSTFLNPTKVRAEKSAADFYVSPSGSDVWSGTLPAPNEQLSNGPFATLERARDAVRKLRESRPGNIVVLIRGGTYRVDKTVLFGLEDSGDGDSTVTYAAYPGETPIFSSGEKIGNWKTLLEVPPGLPREAAGKVRVADVKESFRALFDAEGLLPRARSNGFIPAEGGSRNELRFPFGQLKSWSNIEDVEIVVRPHHAWILNILPL